MQPMARLSRPPTKAAALTPRARPPRALTPIRAASHPNRSCVAACGAAAGPQNELGPPRPNWSPRVVNAANPRITSCQTWRRRAGRANQLVDWPATAVSKPLAHGTPSVVVIAGRAYQPTRPGLGPPSRAETTCPHCGQSQHQLPWREHLLAWPRPETVAGQRPRNLESNQKLQHEDRAPNSLGSIGCNLWGATYWVQPTE